MQTRYCQAAVALACALVGGTANAQLQARDINSDGVTDAYFDSLQNITWLADANYAYTSGYVFPPDQLGSRPPNGAARWVDSVAWVEQLDYFGVTGWRLPQTFLPDCAADPALCPSMTVYASEVTRLYDAVGSSSPFLNTGNLFWSGNTYLTGLGTVYQANGFGQRSVVTLDYNVLGAVPWAVHDGDIGAVSAIPEPSSYALMLAGLAAVCFVRRRGM